MSAGGMAADDQRLPEPRQFTRRHPHLADDLFDGDIGTEIVARNRDADAVGIQPASEMAEKRAVQRLPVAAMNEDDDRAFVVAGEKIDDMCARPDHRQSSAAAAARDRRPRPLPSPP